MGTQNLQGLYKGYEFYFERSKEPLEDFKHRRDRLWLTCLKNHLVAVLRTVRITGRGQKQED